MNSPILLWLDDVRDPTDPQWHVYFPIPNPEIAWVESYAAFVDWITQNGLPDAICFDHDLGEDHSGYDAAKWLTEYCLTHNESLPAWEIQSANTIGKQNIASLLKTFQEIAESGE